jgi:hypothetical protein
MAHIMSRAFLGIKQNVPQPLLASNCNYLYCHRILKITDGVLKESRYVKPIVVGMLRSNGPTFLSTANEVFLLLINIWCFIITNKKLLDSTMLPKNALTLILA